MEQEVTAQVLKAESRYYKSKTGEDKYFNSVSVLLDGDLVEMSCTTDIADYVIKNMDRLKGKEIALEVQPKGFDLLKILL